MRIILENGFVCVTSYSKFPCLNAANIDKLISTSRFQLSSDPTGLPTQIGNKTECAMLGFVIDLGVDYRQVSDINNMLTGKIKF